MGTKVPQVSERNGLDREQRLRRRARELGYVLRKSRTDGTLHRDRTYVGENSHDRGGWMIIDAATSMVITGLRYELTVEDVEAFLAVRT